MMNELMDRYADGACSIAELYDVLAPDVYTHARERASHTDAETLVQQTFLYIHTSRDAWPGGDVRAWALAIVDALLEGQPG